MDKQILNMELEKWAGFYCHSHMGYTDIDSEVYQEDLYNPQGKRIKKEPDFPNDLNACFKWLVPEFRKRFGAESLYQLLAYWVDIVFTLYTNEGEEALALCIAIKKVIGNDNDDTN